MKLNKNTIVLLTVFILSTSVILTSGLYSIFLTANRIPFSNLALSNDNDMPGMNTQLYIISSELTLEHILIPYAGNGISTLSFSDANNLGSFSANVSWDPLVVNISDITSNNFTITKYINNIQGYANITGYSMSGFTGYLPLAVYHFTAVGNPGDTCELNIQYSKILTADPLPSLITHSTTNGSVTITGETTTFTISGMKYRDLNENEIKDITESGLSGWTIRLYSMDCLDNSVVWADDVILYNNGTRKDGGPMDPNTMNASKALGPAEKDLSLNYVALGFGGTLILHFDNLIINAAGPDIKVWETSTCDVWNETIHAYASKDNMAWVYLGSGYQDSIFDLGDLDWATYVKIIDTSNPNDFDASDDAYDVDGVEALHCYSIIDTEITNASGYYTFENLQPGTYIVEEIIQPGWKNITSSFKVVTITSSSISVHFGNNQIINNPNLSIIKKVRETCCSTPMDSLIVEPGDIIYFNITVENTGDIPLDISIKDIIPNGLTILDPLEESYVHSKTYYWNITNVIPQRIISLQFRVMVNTTTCGSLENVVTAYGFINQSIVIIHSDSAFLNIPCGNLTVVKSVKQNCNKPWSDTGITLDPDECDWVTFRINITNMDSHPLNIAVKDILPDAFIYDDSASPKEPDYINNATHTYYWNFTNVAYGTTISITYKAIVKDHMCDIYTNKVNVTGTYSDICENITLYAEDTVYVDVLCDTGITVEKYASLDTINWVNETIDTLIDDVIYFKINVSNTGDVNLSGVKITDIIPYMVNYNYDAYPNLSKPFTNHTLEWFFPDLYIGESKILTYSVTVKDHGVADNIVNVTACGGIPADEDYLTIESEGGMNIRKTVSIDGQHFVDNVTTAIGSTVRFNLTLSYYSEEYTLFHIHIKDILPPGLTYADHASPKEPVIVNNTLYWNFTGETDYLSNGSKIYIEFDATVNDDGALINLVNVTAEECSGSILYDQDTAIVYVPSSPHMNATKLVRANNGSWVHEIQANNGGTATFNITITNLGAEPLYGIDVIDVLPKNLSYVAHSAKIYYLTDVLSVEPTIDTVNNTLLWNNLNFYIGEYLSHGQSISLLYDVHINGYGILKNNATITACKCSQCELQTMKVYAIINVSTTDNHIPEITNPQPAHNATQVNAYNLALRVTVSDGDGDQMNVTFYNASNSTIIGTKTAVSNGTTSQTWGNLAYNTTYTWYVKVSDGKTIVTSATWTFTTELEGTNHPPNDPTNPSPADNANGVVQNPTLSVVVSDPDANSLTVRFYNAADNSIIGTDTCTSNCTASVTWSGRSYSTTYRWYVIVSDGIYNVTSSTWRFTTKSLDVDLNLNFKGGLGINLEIQNSGTDSAYDVSWSIHVANQGFLNRINKTESGTEALIAPGSLVIKSMKIFSIGRVEITAIASCSGATPVTKTQDAFIIGSFVLLR